jgi:DNA (cytosine-5)-methyltransferase 1
MLDLFSGIGGFSYAGEKLVGGYETVAFCEYDKHAQKVLRKHWPDTEIIDDVRELANDADRFRGLVDIVVGGYPCQPFSLAGVRRGDKDDRHLWPEMLRIIQAVRPTWVIGENVAGHISMGLDTVLSDLEAEGYQARCFVIPAVAADACHRRDRCWIVAHTDSQGQSNGSINEQRMARAIVGDAEHDGSSATTVRRSTKKTSDNIEERSGKTSQPAGTSRPRDGQEVARGAGATDVAYARCQQQGAEVSRSGGQSVNGASPGQRTEARDRFADCDKNVADADCVGSENQQRHQTKRQFEQSYGARWWKPEPAVGRVADGVSGRVHRLRQLGNSIVPQVAARILWAIKQVDEGLANEVLADISGDD